MQFVLSAQKIKNGKVAFIIDAGVPGGVRKITEKVREDIRAVFGAAPQIFDLGEFSGPDAAKVEYPILVSLSASKKGEPECNILTKLEESGLMCLDEVTGKREVYLHKVIGNLPVEVLLPRKKGKRRETCLSCKESSTLSSWKSVLVIAGSDKRGAIYGLFALSEKLGVSPFIDWLDVKPPRKSSFTMPGKYEYISKEPSVRFRGFFINDEWPAFGNWCNKRFGGFNAKCYEHVFELLLRLKGNYLWPAMWSAIFPDDGPDLQNCELADELGVVMGMSHHEPCLRQGEEYRYLRGPDSIYGDAWNFITNEKGITKFWEDGLKRSGRFENVITVGMRGEQDTAIMGKEATLADNIALLRKVLKTQNRLIKKHVNPNLDEVPRMLALYKEVEPYFYGDETTPGLMGDPELEGVTLMLCDDNYGNLRTVPTKQMRNHKGGYGMYYHFDYHGFPISFEWFNTTHLSKVWEQMTMAYDFGIRDLWIVNVGDIFSNEYPLSFFLDLAYDFDKWGTGNLSSAHEYTNYFVKKNFGDELSSSQRKKTSELLLGYTRITHARRTEAMNDSVYAPFAYGETEELLSTIEDLMCDAQSLYEQLSDNVQYRFYEIVYLPLMANLNVQKMWLLTTLNHAYAKRGSTYAMTLAEAVGVCLEKDRELVAELHKIHGGMWYGMGLSEHIGFKNWCEEGCQYPVVHTFEPGNKERLIVAIPGTDQYSECGPWTRKTLCMPAFMDPRAGVGHIEITTACAKGVPFTVECSSPYLKVSKTQGLARAYGRTILTVQIDREVLKAEETCSQITVRSGDGFVSIQIPIRTADRFAEANPAPNTFFWCGEGYISIDSSHFFARTSGAKGSFREIPDYNRGLSAMKAFPQDQVFSGRGDAPVLSYRVVLPKDGEYTLRLLTNPGNPSGRMPELFVGVSANGGKMKRVNTIRKGFAVGDGNDIWSEGVLDNLRSTEVTLDLKAGSNDIDITALSPNLVLTRIVLFEQGEAPMNSYLGPTETYHR
ncbi:MAG: glycosyl hydrolase 115 family protein [Clostridiales bacterium]|nr:glycosyl hydrolase 115 family protein [Clostridiales bacterium]